MTETTMRSRNILEPKKDYKPFHYPELDEFTKTLRRDYWDESEVDFTSDKQDFFVNLDDKERYIIGTILKTFAQTEVHVADEFWNTIPQITKHVEVARLCAANTESEYRHADAYIKLNEVLQLEDYESFKEDAVANARFESLVNREIKTTRDLAMTMLIFGGIVEYCNLFSQFAILASFSSNGRSLLKNVGSIITWSRNDEALHAKSAIFIYKTILAESKEVINDDKFKKDFIEAVEIAFGIEVDLINQIFAKGDLPNLAKDALLNYMKNRLNEVLSVADCDPLYEIDKDLLKELDWFENAIQLVDHTDNFSNRNTSYTKRLVAYSPESTRVTSKRYKQLQAKYKSKVNRFILKG